MPFDFTVAFQNGESYLLHMKDGSWVLADRETGEKSVSDFADKFLRFGLFREVTDPLPENIMLDLDDIAHDRVQNFELTNEEVEGLLGSAFDGDGEKGGKA